MHARTSVVDAPSRYVHSRGAVDAHSPAPRPQHGRDSTIPRPQLPLALAPTPPLAGSRQPQYQPCTPGASARKHRNRTTTARRIRPQNPRAQHPALGPATIGRGARAIYFSIPWDCGAAPWQVRLREILIERVQFRCGAQRDEIDGCSAWDGLISGAIPAPRLARRALGIYTV